MHRLLIVVSIWKAVQDVCNSYQHSLSIIVLMTTYEYAAFQSVLLL